MAFLNDRRIELITICGALVAVGGAGIVFWQCRAHRRKRDLELQLIRQDVSDLRCELNAVRVVVNQGGLKNHSHSSPTKSPPPPKLTPLLRLPSDGPRRGSSSKSMVSDDEYMDAIEQWSPNYYDQMPFASAMHNDGNHATDKTVTFDGDYVNFEKIDELLELGEGKAAFEELKLLYHGENRKNPAVLWRLAKACYVQGNSYTGKDPKKKDLLLEGRHFANEGYAVAPNDPLVLKWAAVTTGSCTEYLGTKEKIEQGFVFKKYLDQALSLTPTDYSLLHMRGRYAYSVANLSWLERKAASAFFAAPPVATIDEALHDFLEVEKLRPKQWIENLLYVGRCQLTKGNKLEAVKSLQSASEIEPADDADQECLAEVLALLAKHRPR